MNNNANVKIKEWFEILMSVKSVFELEYAVYRVRTQMKKYLEENNLLENEK